MKVKLLVNLKTVKGIIESGTVFDSKDSAIPENILFEVGRGNAEIIESDPTVVDNAEIIESDPTVVDSLKEAVDKEEIAKKLKRGR